ncbi:MAG: transporter [Planctomycetota bacterium]
MQTFAPPHHRSTSRLGLLRRFARCGVALALSTGAIAAQGETGFLRGQGNLDVVLSYNLDTYDEFWMGREKVSPAGVGEVDRTTYNLYAAYGLNDDVDLILSGSYVESESDGTAGAPDERDFQDLVVAAKWRLLRRQYGWGEASFLVLPGVKVPLTDYEDNAITAIGDGNVDWRLRVVGHAQTHQGFFASLETGYDFRVGDPPNEFPLHLQVGGTIADRVTIAPFISRINAQGGTDISDVPMPAFPTNEEEYSRAGINAYVRINDHFGLTGNYRTTFDGRNTGDVEGFSLGLVFRR